MSNKYEDLIKNARINADCGEHMSPAEVTTLLNVVETTFAALAAENAGLKAACERVSMWNEFPQATLRSTGEVVPYVVAYGSNGERDYMRNIATTALKETPATDAFLAEVRASGVEMAMEHMQSSGSLTFGDCYISLNDFADNLRKGVQS